MRFCGQNSKENCKSQTKFAYQVCGYTAYADVNAADYILTSGDAVSAFGGELVSSAYPFVGTLQGDSDSDLNAAGIHDILGGEDVNESQIQFLVGANLKKF
ncbi:hypothetical protein KOSB73_100047 [Klebsiella grimontii]|uniref:Uncharacterized protein n=1 Tax=Klebsiella grimontii TaxID=2058152 RepID=A0A285AV95_9ENTR|nr:hypothetical protein KOSB73_100047 [Klebsiella grimontii]